MSKAKLRTFPSPRRLTEEAAMLLRNEITASTKARGILLAGGNTPLPVYGLAFEGTRTFPPRLRLFLTDERFVPESSPFNNRSAVLAACGEAAEAVAAVLPAVVTAGLSVEENARRYDGILKDFRRKGGTFPLGIFGIGADGHTAGIFSLEGDIRNTTHAAVQCMRPDGMAGITITPHIIGQVEHIIVLATGTSKQEAVRSILEGNGTVAAEVFAPHPHVEVWFAEGDPPRSG